MVSNIGDDWQNNFPQNWPNFPKPDYIPSPEVTKAEFDALRREVEELKKLLIAAKEFDRATGQPDCEMDAKVEMVRKIAKFVGVDMGDVFGKPKKTKKGSK